MHLKRWLQEFLQTIFGGAKAFVVVLWFVGNSRGKALCAFPGKTGTHFSWKLVEGVLFAALEVADFPELRKQPRPEAGDGDGADAAEDDRRTVPISAAIVPARNSPSSFDAPTKTMLTALTRPRRSSGVQSWIRVSRT